jgi:hypothetical protein
MEWIKPFELCKTMILFLIDILKIIIDFIKNDCTILNIILHNLYIPSVWYVFTTDLII